MTTIGIPTLLRAPQFPLKARVASSGIPVASIRPAMRILRHGGQYADNHIWRYGKTAIWSFLGCVTVVVLFFFVSYEFVALFGFIAAFLHFRRAYNKWENWFLGKRGELAVRRELEALPDDYILLNDLFLPNGRGNIDHVLIGPNGLFVIETKNYSSDVKCTGDQWFVNGKPTQSLSMQAKGSALAARKALEPLFSEHRVKLPFIEPLLVFVKHTHRLDLNEPTVTVLRLEELVDFIRSYQPRTQSRFPCFSPELIRAIVRHLQSEHVHKEQQGKKARGAVGAPG
jgi:hypothetical protein